MGAELAGLKREEQRIQLIKMFKEGVATGALARDVVRAAKTGRTVKQAIGDVLLKRARAAFGKLAKSDRLSLLSSYCHTCAEDQTACNCEQVAEL